MPGGLDVLFHTFILHVILLQLLEETVTTFVRSELKIFQQLLSPGDTADSEGQERKEDMLDREEEEHRRSSREALLKIILHFLRKMKQEELAASLQSSKSLFQYIVILYYNIFSI